MPDVLEIHLYPPYAECWACGDETPARWGLPIRSDTAELADNDYEGDWGGVPACEACWRAHAEGLLTEASLRWWRQRRRREAEALRLACHLGDDTDAQQP